MPITTERLNDLLIEHEQCLVAIRTLKEQIELLITDAEYGDQTTKDMLPFQIKGLIAQINRLPDAVARIERKHYKSTIKRTLNTRERMRMLRRRNGVPERQEPSNDIAEVLANMRADREYNRLNAVPYGADGKPMIDPEAQSATRAEPTARKSYVYDPDKPMKNDEFLAMLGEAPVPKTPEEIAAEGLAMLDSLPSDDEVADAANTIYNVIEPLMGKLEPKTPWLSPVEHEITKKFTSK